MLEPAAAGDGGDSACRGAGGGARGDGGAAQRRGKISAEARAVSGGQGGAGAGAEVGARSLWRSASGRFGHREQSGARLSENGTGQRGQKILRVGGGHR